MLKKIWIAVLGILLIGIALAFWQSPFIHSQGPFAQFARERAVPAAVIGIGGTLILIIGGWRLLKNGSR